MKNYANSGTDIQSAMIDMVRSHPDKGTRPDHILWGGQKVFTAHWLDVSEHFHIKLELLSEPDPNQGVDMHPQGGHLVLQDGSQVPLLRTWHSAQYEPCVEYPGTSPTGRLSICNVYKVFRNGKVFEEKWTGNAGMLIEQKDRNQREYRCSMRDCSPPDFSKLRFRVTISEAKP